MCFLTLQRRILFNASAPVFTVINQFVIPGFTGQHQVGGTGASLWDREIKPFSSVYFYYFFIIVLFFKVHSHPSPGKTGIRGFLSLFCFSGGK